MALMSSPAPAAQTQATYTGTTSWARPGYIDPRDSINNSLGQAGQNADFRGLTNQQARQGFSLGKAAQYAAGIQSMQSQAAGRQEAAKTQFDADKANAQMRLDYQTGQEQEAQRFTMIQHALSQSNWSVAQAQAQALARVNAATQSGMLQLENATV